MIDCVLDRAGEEEADVSRPSVREHILRNVHGLECLVPPWAVAHLALAQHLADRVHPLAGDERPGIHLTDTLDPASPWPDILPPDGPAEETRGRARPVLVIVGNPPYSGRSANRGRWISDLIADYRRVPERDANGREVLRPLRERNAKWLQDDYVKFIRFAQWAVERAQEGIVGIVTNHAWIDNPTFRGMRSSLLRTFQRVYVLDLHGNRRRRERAPDGGPDENVFDVQQGAAIVLLVRKPGLEPAVLHADLRGSRADKYRTLAAGGLDDIPWERVDPLPPRFVFRPHDAGLHAEYHDGWPLTRIFPVHSAGIVTARDRLSIHFTREELMRTLADLVALPTDEVRAKYGLSADAPHWKLEWAQEDARRGWPDGANAIRIVYRPFDCRWTWYTGHSHGLIHGPRREVAGHMPSGGNIALTAARKIDVDEGWSHVLCADGPIDHHATSTKEVNYFFPLWLYDGPERTENIADALRGFLRSLYGFAPTAREILGCVYAIMHCPTYRSRYADFLRCDFPRVPFPEDAGDFRDLSRLGLELVDVHLLRTAPVPGSAKLHGDGEPVVGKVRYDAGERTVRIGPDHHLAPVPPDVWDFRIGGCRVLKSFIEARRGRVLSREEIVRIERIAAALATTVRYMERIDRAWHRAFPDRTR